MNQFLERLPYFLMFLPIMAVHEATHAWAAHKLGDDTAKDDGRLTLNPLVHIDLFGTILIPAINIFMGPGMFFIGWGKPVPVDVNQLRNYRRDEILVALAGPLANVLLAFVVLVAARMLPPGHALVELAINFALVSVILGVFNLLPVPPLDGYVPFKHLFRLPDDLIERGGFWWVLALLIMINFPPLMHGIQEVAKTIVGIITLLLHFHFVAS